MGAVVRDLERVPERDQLRGHHHGGQRDCGRGEADGRGEEGGAGNAAEANGQSEGEEGEMACLLQHTPKDTCYNTSASSTRNIHPHLYRITIANTEQTTCNTSSQRVRFFSDMGPNRYKNTLMSV